MGSRKSCFRRCRRFKTVGTEFLFKLIIISYALVNRLRWSLVALKIFFQMHIVSRVELEENNIEGF